MFLAPHSYRFTAMLEQELGGAAAGLRIADVGTGAGVGGSWPPTFVGGQAELSDINPLALRLARINLAHAGPRRLRASQRARGPPARMT